MSRHIVTFMILLMVEQAAHALIVKDFTTDGVIVNNDLFDTVNILSGAIVNMTGGEVTQTITIYDTSVLNITGGAAPDFIYLRDSSVLNLSGGDYGDPSWVTWIYLGASTQNIINIYGYGLSLSPYYSSHTLVTGHWNDESSFSFIVGRREPACSQIVLHEIPEPATLLLLAIGAVAVRKRSGR